MVKFLGLTSVGRRRELIIAALLYAAGGSLTAYAPGLGALLLGRLVYGLGIGLVGFVCFLVIPVPPFVLAILAISLP